VSLLGARKEQGDAWSLASRGRRGVGSLFQAMGIEYVLAVDSDSVYCVKIRPA